MPSTSTTPGEPVREYVIENVLRWIHEYHVDGLRLDATDTIKDDSPRHILTDLNSAAVGTASARTCTATFI